MIRPNLALAWAFLATLTGASSTVAYLFIAHKQPWAAEFIQLYSCLGMISGWLNALIYFLAPRSLFLQTRKAAILFFLSALSLACWAFAYIFHHDITSARLFFLMVNLVPVLYANAFGIEFHEGNYPWPYKRVVSFNGLLLLGALGALLFSRSEAGLYRWSLLAGIPFLFLWSADKWNRIDVPKESARTLKPWLNPSLPVLERTLWDQWALARLDILKWSFGIYVLSRLVTFTGNVAYSYLLSINSGIKSSRPKAHPAWAWAAIVVAAPIAAGAVKYPWCAFFLGQFFAWLITALLTSEYDSQSKLYRRFLFIWIGDFCLRAIGILVSQDIKDYLPFLVFSSLAGIIFSLLLWRKKLQQRRQEKTNTRFPPADSLNIR